MISVEAREAATRSFSPYLWPGTRLSASSSRRSQRLSSRSVGPPADVKFLNMTEADEVELEARLGPRSGAAEEIAAGADHGRPRPRRAPVPAEPRPNPFADKSSKTRVLAISSGKGGVGKSTVSVNLAVALARRGASVGILDADVYGFSVPSMLAIDRPPSLLGELLIPPVAHGVRCISMGFFVEEDQAVMWRGPMLHKALEQFLVDVHWGRSTSWCSTCHRGPATLRCRSLNSCPERRFLS